MHEHTCPACHKKAEHEKFGKVSDDPVLQSIARAIHRFCGGCEKCIKHFIDVGDIFQDPQIETVRKAFQAYITRDPGPPYGPAY